MSINITSANMPVNFCHRSWQETWNTMWHLLSAESDGTISTVVGIAEPDPTDRDKVWFRLNADGSPDKIYTYWNGQWVSPHPLPPGPAGLVVMFEGSLASIGNYDGGVAIESVTPTSGPMWEQVAQLNARSPIGPGTLPSGTVINSGDSGGEEKHTQTIPELAAHSHPFASGQFPKSLLAGIDTSVREGTINQTGSLDYVPLTQVQDTGSSTPFNVLHPYYGIYFIRRTTRRFYRV